MIPGNSPQFETFALVNSLSELFVTVYCIHDIFCSLVGMDVEPEKETEVCPEMLCLLMCFLSKHKMHG